MCKERFIRPVEHIELTLNLIEMEKEKLMSTNKGLFITFEGIDGSGKSTQANQLSAYLSSIGKPHIITREPGGTKLGKVLRSMILSGDYSIKNGYTELLLFVADRLEHVENIIKPALQEGKIVICDRYIDSTEAYQCGGRDVNQEVITYLNKVVGLVPDLTLLFDLDLEEALRRVNSRTELDKFDKEDITFFNKVKSKYLEIAEREKSRVRVVDVRGKSKSAVSAEVIDLLLKII